MPEKREDRRTQYSKRVIREALYELMQEKPLNKITVTEICALADVNRSTFYAYYTDIFNLHESIIKEFYTVQKLDRVISTIDGLHHKALFIFFQPIGIVIEVIADLNNAALRLNAIGLLHIELNCGRWIALGEINAL